jgi:septal ring factor EnvC (AmiA/AmiB activator)
MSVLRAAAALFLLLALAPARARAQPAAQAKKQELGQVQKELEATRRDLDEFRRQEQSLGQELHKIESRTGDARRRIETLRRNVQSAESKKKELKARLIAVGQASGYWKGSAQGELRAYARAQASSDDAFGREDLWREAYRRAAILEKVELIAGLQGISRTTALAEAESRLKAQELSQRHRQAQKEQASTQREYEQKKAVMAQTQEKVAAAAAHAKELEESAKALTRLIRSLREPRKPGKTTQVAHWDVPPNSLLWPAQGAVLKPFGRQRNPELNTWVINQGIMIQTPLQAQVAAVRGGKVIFCGPFRSYGQVMILDHGANFFSIYGGLGEILKPKGSEVQPGEIIAKAGAPKAGDGGRLYLELRRGTEALDPLVWLQKR